jgi:hypothetical protein
MKIERVMAATVLGGLLVLLTSCSSAKSTTEQPTEAPSTGQENPATACDQSPPQSPEHCECLGGYVKGDIGDGQVACTDGETELERVQQGIEGAVCCKK